MPAILRGLTVPFLAAAAMAQPEAPVGLVRGDLVSWEGTPQSGKFTFRATGERLYSCSYDRKTYFEREHQRISMAGAEKGDRLEVLTDRQQGSDACYALTVHVLDVGPRNLSWMRLHSRVAPAAADPSPARGDLTFSGQVVRVSAGLLTLKSRSGKQQAIHLRPDTRFLLQGQPAEVGSLRANTLVFVRAGRNGDDQVEAYQVIWGRILEPQP